MDLELTDRVFLVTGGSDGLGAATADRLAAEGANVAICGRSRERLDAAAERLARHGTDVLPVATDVTRPDELSALVDAVVTRWGRMDGLVNNAGAHTGGRFEEIPDADWEADVQLKVLAATRASRLSLPMLRESRGSILNVLSIGAKAPERGSMPS